jgi:hypothetical protein
MHIGFTSRAKTASVDEADGGVSTTSKAKPSPSASRPSDAPADLKTREPVVSNGAMRPRSGLAFGQRKGLQLPQFLHPMFNYYAAAAPSTVDGAGPAPTAYSKVAADPVGASQRSAFPPEDFAESDAAVSRSGSAAAFAQTLRAAAREDNVNAIRDFALGPLKAVPEGERLAWLREAGADRSMQMTMARGSAEAIKAWRAVLSLLPASDMVSFLGRELQEEGLVSPRTQSIATSIYGNTNPDTMNAWAKVLDVVPDTHQERSRLLLAREDGIPAFAQLFERQDSKALDQFVELAQKHVWSGNTEIEGALMDCESALKKLTSDRGEVRGRQAMDWAKPDGLHYVSPHGLYGARQDTARAFGQLVRLVPKEHRTQVLLPEHVWMVKLPTGNKQGTRSALNGSLHPYQARDLAHSITVLKEMVPDMNAEERKNLLDNIRSLHATKTMGTWMNTRDYKAFKAAWPAVDAMLLDLKAELKKPVPPRSPTNDGAKLTGKEWGSDAGRGEVRSG